MRIFFSVGEPSGDQHTAHLIQSLRERNPALQAEGFGGPAMGEQGCRLLFDLTQLAVIGFLRVIPMLAKFRRLVIKAEEHFDTSPPDAVVLVDFPGFNWWIARAAKARGIPVYYYLPPQLWGWAPWRIRKVRRFVDHVICALPFEYDWYRDRGVEATWVGHPFFDEVAAKQLDDRLMTQLERQGSQPIIGVLPGSRNGEVRRNFPVMLDVIRRVSELSPNVRWLVGGYREDQVQLCRDLYANSEMSVPLEFFVDRTSEVIEASDCCLMVSGSISLELLARQTPGIVLYRVARYEKFGARLLMNCRFITLTNLIADEELMPEFILAGQMDQDLESIVTWLHENCSSPDVLAARRQQMTELAAQAAITGATDRTADLILKLMEANRSAARHAA